MQEIQRAAEAAACRGAKTPWQARAVLLLVAASLLAAYVLTRLASLDALPIFFDEAHYTLSAMLIGHDPLHADLFTEVAYWGVPPLFTWLAAPLTQLMDPLFAARLTSAAIGLAGLYGVWRCAGLLGPRWSAPAAAACYVGCPFLLWYQRMAMVDGLLATVGVFALLATMRLAERPAARPALLLGACLALGCLSKITGPLLFLLPAIAVAVAPPHSRRAVARLAAPALLCGVATLLLMLAGPGGSSLVVVAHQQQGSTLPLAQRLLAQGGVIAQSFALYVTLPLLGLALIGARRAWATPAGRVVTAWALCGWAPFLVIHLAARYLLPAAVPVMILAGHGLVSLLGRDAAPGGARRAWRNRALALTLCTLAVGMCLWEDTAAIAAPASAPLLAGDREQYVTGWPAGYALQAALDRLSSLAGGRAVTLLAAPQNPPGDSLLVLAARYPRVRLRFYQPGTLTRAALRFRGMPVYVLTAAQAALLPPMALVLRRVAFIGYGDAPGGVSLYASP